MYMCLFPGIVKVVIINVSRTLIIGLPRKRNGCPNEYITLVTLISAPKPTLSLLWRLIYRLQPMAKLAEPLTGIRNTARKETRN